MRWKWLRFDSCDNWNRVDFKFGNLNSGDWLWFDSWKFEQGLIQVWESQFEGNGCSSIPGIIGRKYISSAGVSIPGIGWVLISKINGNGCTSSIGVQIPGNGCGLTTAIFRTV